MSNFERGDAGCIAVARFQLGNRLPSVAARRSQSIERRVIAFRDIAALPGIGRRRGNQGAGEQIDHRTVTIKPWQQSVEQFRPVRHCAQPFAQRPCAVQTVAYLANVARTSASSDDAAQRTGDVGQLAQRRAHRVAEQRRIVEPLDQRQPRFDPGLVHQRRGQIGSQLPCARAGNRPVHLGEERTRTPAFAGGVDFKAVARRLIDQQMLMHFAPHRHFQKRHFALTDMCEISDEAASRRQLRTR